MAIITVLFILRVTGQALVAFFNVSFLPPMAHWYSGLLPYPILLPVQLFIIVVMLKIVADFTRGHGYFVVPRKRIGPPLKWLSYLYFSSMVLRYIFTMAWHPERRWLNGTIPIWFHMLLAGFLYTLSHYYLRASSFTDRHMPSVR